MRMMFPCYGVVWYKALGTLVTEYYHYKTVLKYMNIQTAIALLEVSDLTYVDWQTCWSESISKGTVDQYLE